MEIRTGSDVENVECENVLHEETDKLLEKGKEMIEFCVNEGGLGLAGPQIGLKKKIIVWTRRNNIMEIGINPVYYKDGDSTTNTVEGCLSYPDERYYLKRYKRIIANYYLPDKNSDKMIKVVRKMSGDEAINFQHEVDHIKGITIATRGERID